jgi:hypothetical protein
MFLKISPKLWKCAGDLLCEPKSILDLLCDGVGTGSTLEGLP